MNKYNARKVMIDGITFDSQREAARYQELKLLERAGEITWLEVHPSFELLPCFAYNGKRERATHYEADFQYQQNGKVIVEDVKGISTEAFRLKRKMFLFVHGDKYDFRIVR